MIQPEALRLADALDYGVYDAQMARVMDKAAAELRRLHAENETLGVHLSERMKDLFKVEAQRDALLEALKIIAGDMPCIDNLMSDKEIARAAIAKCEENT